jgi:hypothetical protein
MCWHSWLTENEISGLVRVQYNNAPTTLRYSVGSERESPSRADNLVPAGHGEEAGLAPSILTRCRRSVMYLVWLRWSSVKVWVAWMPKKNVRLTRSLSGNCCWSWWMMELITDDECQILCIWTPWFALVRPLALLFSNVLVSFCVFCFCRIIREEWQIS